MRRAITKHDLLCIVLMWAPVLLGAVASALGATPTQYLSVAGVAATIACWIYFAHVARPREEWLTRMNAVTAALWDALDGSSRGSPTSLSNTTDPIKLTQSLEDAAAAISARATRATAATANLRSVYDASHSVSLATDDTGAIVLANQAASQFFSRSSFENLSIESVFTNAGVLDQHKQALRGKTIVSQMRFATQEGPRIFQVLTAPLPLVLVSDALVKRSTSGAIVTLRDVTELALAVQLKTDFVANASHELRTPLASIRGAIETLSDGGWEEEQLRTRLSTMISTNVERLEELVRDLLDLSRLESPDAPGASMVRESLSLLALTESVVGTFHDACARRNLKIDVDVHPLANSIASDRTLLTLIVRNLIENATKFAYEGTTIRVVATRHEDLIRIDVIDRGVGIPLSQQARIFERFYQVEASRTGASQHSPSRGTGLGLSIVKHAVKTLGGSISVESVWGEGTTMRVEIPHNS
ncbi:MAG: ATP-binding protein [Phycisphaerales bacterium]